MICFFGGLSKNSFNALEFFASAKKLSGRSIAKQSQFGFASLFGVLFWRNPHSLRANSILEKTQKNSIQEPGISSISVRLNVN